MSYYDNNPYYHPEALSLEIVGVLEFSDLDYQFDTRIVWRHIESGVFYTARDSGCSCPCPFEDYNSLEDLTVLNSWDDLLDEIEAEKSSEYGGNPDFENESAEFIGNVRRVMLDTPADGAKV